MKKLVKKISLLLVFIFCFSSFSGCEKAGSELSELMIIQGIGIDTTDDGFFVTVEMLNNQQNGSPNGSGTSENKTKIYTSRGKTVAEALRSLIVKSGNKPLFAHNRVVVIGENAMNTDISDLLDFFFRNYDSRASQLLCVARDGKAEDIIRAELLKDTVKSQILENMLEESYEQSLVPRVRVIDAVNIIKSRTGVLCIPAVSLSENEKTSDYMLNGCALFGNDNTFSMYLSSEESKGLAFLNNEIKKGFITTELSNGYKATFVINKGKTRYSIGHIDGELVYKLKISLSCDIDEISGSEYFSTRNDFFEKMKSSISQAVCKTTENTIVALKGEHGGDSVRYGKRLQLYDNKLYNELSGNWKEEFKNAHTVVSVDVNIRRIGEATFHSKKTG